MITNKTISKYKFGDMVFIGLSKGIVVKCETKRKWTYYEVIWEDAEEIVDDWFNQGRVTEVIREDKL